MHNRGNSTERSKDFVGSIKRLLKELKSFKIFIFVALILATTGSILSIIAPNQLSKLTDTISQGLVVKSENIKKITETTTKNLSNLDPKIIMTSSRLSAQEKSQFMTIIKDIDKNDQKKLLKNLSLLSNNTLNLVLPEIKIEGQKISSKDQIEYLNILSDLDKKPSAEKLYKNIDKMPKSIQNVIKPYMNMGKIKSVALFLGVMYLISALFEFIESILMTDVANNFAKKLRSRISIKINKLPLKYFDKHQTGDILSRVTNDVDTIAQSMNQSLSTLVSAITLFIGTIIMMFYTNWIMALTAIVASLIGFVFMFIILGKSQKYFVQRQVELGKLNSHIEETYSGLLVVKAYNGKKDSDKKFDKYNKSVYEANRKSQFLSGLMMPLMNFIGNFGYVAVCIVGAILTSNNIITFGVIVAFITYVRLFTSPLAQIAQAMNVYLNF